MASFTKIERPAVPGRGRISDRDLDIVEATLRYRFSPTSELVRLVGGNEDVTQRRLRKLWEWEFVNRLAFPGYRAHSEFIYYLDCRRSLELLVQHGRLSEFHPQMDDELRMNQDADYAGAVTRGQHMKLGFLQHSLMISRMHFMLEMAGRSAQGRVEVAAWRQGAELRGNKVNVPEIRSRRINGTNEYTWDERDDTIRLPVEPDALFSLRLHTGQSQQQLHFCYEADRGCMPMADMLKKFRAYYHFIKRQQKHKDAFGVHPIRAVLVETTSEARARKLMELAQHPAVVGASKRSGLFWLTISPLFAEPVVSESANRALPSYLDKPAIVLNPIWALPDRSLHALGDVENTASAVGPRT
jgi:hypothetical protein